MANQKQINEAYSPDKTTRKEKVVLGLSGGLDSRVAAYLLKIQKYDLIAVTIVPDWEELSKDNGGVLSCAVNEKTVEELKKFCHQLSIPFFPIRIPGEFRDRVVERWVSKRAQGEYADQCWDCHKLRMEFLFAKMKEFGAKYLATGHFAKVFRQDPEGASVVQTSNDEIHDQSALLSRLPQDILESLLLPLSDLQKKEVLKLAENFGVGPSGNKVKMFNCFPKNDMTIKYLETVLPDRLRMVGDIFSRDDDHLGEHEGIFRHVSGEAVAMTPERKPLRLGRYKLHDRKIFAYENSWFERRQFLLRNCQIPPETPWLTPFRGVLLKDGKPFEGWFYPKTLSACAVELDSPVSLIEGEVLSVVRKKGKNARVLLSGEVFFVDQGIQEGDENAQINYGRDF